MSARTSGITLQELKKQNQSYWKLFPYKLWQLLNECNDGAIRWSETGDYIAIDQARFLISSDVVTHFQTIQFKSFIRQLNMYGFRKIFPNHKQGQCACQCHVTSPFVYYQHDHFRRWDVGCLSQVTRQRKQKTVTNGNDSYANIPFAEPLVQISVQAKDLELLTWNESVEAIEKEHLELSTDPNFNPNSLANFHNRNSSDLYFQDNAHFTENTDVKTDWNIVTPGELNISKVKPDDESYESETKWTGVICVNKKTEDLENVTEVLPLSTDRRQFSFDSDGTRQSINLFEVDVLLSVTDYEEPMDLGGDIETEVI